MFEQSDMYAFTCNPKQVSLTPEFHMVSPNYAYTKYKHKNEGG